MADKKQAYRISILIGTRIFAGQTENGLSIKPNFEEVLLKANNGDAQEEFVDFDTEMNVSGLTYEKGSTEAASHYDYSDLRALASSGGTVAFVYGEMAAGEAIVSGNAKVAEFSETEGSGKNAGNWSVKLRGVKGTIVFGIYAG